MVDAHVGDLGVALVEMTDADGRVTDTYDVISGIVYESSNPAVVVVVDDDAEPKDARLDFLAVSPDPVRVTVRFDGDPGDGVRAIELISEDIMVVELPPGEATGGTVTIRFTPVGV